mgnify:CR=1 FL=1
MLFDRYAGKPMTLTEDDQKTGEVEVQNITDDHIRKVDELVKEKEKEIMEF